MRFAHLKTTIALRGCTCGLSGARDEFRLAAIVQNLKTLTLRLIRSRAHELRPVSRWRESEAEARTREAKAQTDQVVLNP
jgi:hypothetical protein